MDEVVKNIVRNHPSSGEVMVNAHLKSKGIYLQRKRLRECLVRIDEEGRFARRLHTINRRQYYSPCPNYVWHLDGTHKLLRWRFIVHVGIDGFSRLVTYCQCSTNNRAVTVLKLFQEAEQQYGLPLRVRTDYGVENVRVWEYVMQRHLNSNSVIAGSSVHNQRIERLNRDVNVQVLNNFYNQFMNFEERGLLDPLDENDIFCLHLLYLPVINQRLLEFKNAHNNHAISTEHHRTPLQLFHMHLRLLCLQHLDPTGALNIGDIVQHSNNNITIPPVAAPPTHVLRAFRDILHRNVQDDVHVLYMRCIRFLRRLAVNL